MEEPEGEDFIPDSWVRDFGDVQVGFVGAVTEDLPSLVRPAGIEEIEVTDIVEATNAAADDLEAEGADVIVLLVHEGAATTDIADATNDSAFGQHRQWRGQQHRRHRVRSHAPGLQPRDHGPGLGRGGS